MQLIPESYQVSIKRLLEILLPDYSFNFVIEKSNNPLIKLKLAQSSFKKGEPIQTELTLIDGNKRYLERRYHYDILDSRYGELDYERRGKDLLKTHIYTFLVQYLEEEISPWGILTGIRPTKIVHYLRDKGFEFEELKKILKEVYVISDEKIDLLIRIGQIEEKYLPTKNEAAKRISIYIGIPFCPSRCDYCSFPAFSLQKHRRFMEPFLKTLFHEIEVVGEFILKQGYKVDSIYIGGGTPTSLTTAQMEKLLQCLEKHIPFDYLQEYNVEAGRPDTITPEMLVILRDAGVTRISINPQTMQQKTLDAIGRHHTVDQIKNVFTLAREVGFDNINMDLIIGLPGENFTDVQSTIEEVLRLKPDSVTVHTLSLKKAARWWGKANELPFPDDKELTRMLDYVDRVLRENQLLPYYMYRQKYILANQENVGYAISGKESLYNMIMIDERETVIGLGGGAVTKVVNPKDWSLNRHSNPKYPGDYIDQIDKILNEKLSLLTSLQ
ncbi:coproporphyrinogen dehydrogenase HemZ [Anoxybacter fermentans]|uniref:Coproporphyrinogen dehydrogenase HemZ n=1 Tax=Anoxybacter fermentans TaxID=1323375 RepID=A0A3S9T2S4_9FIRM|nr:coproporphyrinogen dehydrogenase HemZ [Anoxybacter fermentans]